MDIIRQLRSTIASFLGLMAAAFALAAAKKSGIILPPVATRGIGFIIGVSTALVGNLLPKVRPLTLLVADSEQSRLAERSAGWMLVLTGAVWSGLFLFAEPPTAKRIASLIAIATLLMIALTWIRLVYGAGRPATAPSKATRQGRALMLSLLCATFYVVVTASVGWLFGLAWWAVPLLWVAFAGLSAVVSSRAA